MIFTKIYSYVLNEFFNTILREIEIFSQLFAPSI